VALGGLARYVEPHPSIDFDEIDDASRGMPAACVGDGQHRPAFHLLQQLACLLAAQLRADEQDVAALGRFGSRREPMHRQRPLRDIAPGHRLLQLPCQHLGARYPDDDRRSRAGKGLEGPFHVGSEFIEEGRFHALLHLQRRLRRGGGQRRRQEHHG
jgi:hypothetical protein